jgi:hypothetical protein
VSAGEQLNGVEEILDIHPGSQRILAVLARLEEEATDDEREDASMSLEVGIGPEAGRDRLGHVISAGDLRVDGCPGPQE